MTDSKTSQKVAQKDYPDSKHVAAGATSSDPSDEHKYGDEERKVGVTKPVGEKHKKVIQKSSLVSK